MMKDALSKRFRRGARMALLLALCGALSLMEARAATTLAEYRERVRSSLVSLDALAALCEELKNGERYEVWSKSSEEEKDRALTLPDMEKKTLATVRQALPPTDTVEWNGASVVVNNAWLHTALDEYAKRSATQSDNGKRATMARAIADRLRALDARLAEAEGAGGTAAAARDKDAEKGRLATILRGKEYAREANEGGAIQRLIKQITDWLSELFPDIKPIQPGGMGRPSRAAEYIIFALALAAIAIIIWKYWLRRRDRVPSVAPRAARVVLGERIAPDETASDLLHQAELLAREGELRGAIRKAYVALLCELGDRKIISLSQHKTNRDYLRAVRKGAPAQLYEEMRPLTANFERHWYGLEEADQTDWADFRARCRQALKLK